MLVNVPIGRAAANVAIAVEEVKDTIASPPFSQVCQPCIFAE